MDQATAIEVARYLGERVEEAGVHVAKLILFGSHGRGTAGEESDVDVVVISEDFQGKDLFERVKITGPANAKTIRHFKAPVDVIAMTPEELESPDSLVAQVAREGMALSPA